MKLRRRIILFVSTVLAIGTAVLFAVIGAILESYYERLDEARMRRDFGRVEREVARGLAALELSAGEWARWDRTAAFVERPGDAFLDEGFLPATMTEYRFALVAFFDRSGTMIGLRAADGWTREAAPFGRMVAAWELAPLSGVVAVGGRPLLVAVVPIAGTGGRLALARSLEGDALAVAQETIDATVTVSLAGAPAVPSTGSEVSTGPERVTGRIALPALPGSDGGTVVVTIDRARDRFLERYPPGLFLALVLVAAVCGAFPFVFVDRLVLRRIGRLADEAAGEGESVAGDELDLLAGRVRGIVDDLARSTEGLRESEARWRALVERAPIGIGVHVDGTIRFLNPAALRILHVGSLDEAIGQPFARFVHPDYQGILGERVGALLRGAQLLPTIEEKFVRADGETIVVGVSAATITWGGAPGIMVMFRDVSARKRADEELNRYREHLELVVRDRTSSLTVANERLLREVKERERAEAALRESEELYRTLVATAPIAVVTADASGRMTFLSERARELFGEGDGRELLGRHYAMLVAPEEIDRARHDLEAAVARGHHLNEAREFTMLRTDGTRFPADVNVGIVHDGPGGVRMMIATFVDISARKEAERRLRESEELYRTLVESAPVAVVSIDARGVVGYASERARELFALAPGEDVVGRNALDFVDPQDRGRAIERLAMAGRDFTISEGEYLLLRADGTSFPASATLGAVTGREGRPTQVIMTFLDITARKDAEQKLRESEGLYRTLVAASPLAVAMSDLSGKTIFASGRALDLLGHRSAEEIVGRHSSETIHPEDREKGAALRGRLLAEGVVREEIRMLHSDGHPVPVEVNMGLAREVDGRPIAIVATFADISARLETERRLRESEALYRTLVETAPVAVAMADASGKAIYASPRFAAMVGSDRTEEFVGREFIENVVEEDREAALRHFADTLSPEGSRRMEIRLRRADGASVPVVIHAGRVTDDAGVTTAIVLTFLDVSKRKALEELYRTLVETMPIGVGMTDLSGRITFVSDRLVGLLGLGDREEIVGRSFLEMLAPAERERAATGFPRFLAGEAITPNIMTFRKADGAPLEAEVQLGLVHDPSGTPSDVVVTVADVTARRAAEQRVAESEALYRTLVQTAPIGIIMTDERGTITYLSEKSRAIFGIPTAEETIGTPIASLFPPEDAEEMEGRLASVLRGLTDLSRRRARRRTDGASIELLGRTGVMHGADGAAKRIVIAFMDVTEMARISQALEDSEERHRIIVENAPIGIMIHRKGVLLYNNEVSETMFGYGGDSGVHGMAVMEHIHPEDRAAVEARVRARRQSREGFVPDSYTVRMLCRDGSVKHVRVGVSPIRYHGDAATMVTTVDITDRVRNEEALQRAFEKLETQNLELTRLDRLKDGLVRDVTHELKTPVAKLRMQLELLERSLAAHGKTEDDARAIIAMRESLMRQESVIRNILNLARLEAGGRKYERVATRVDRILDEVVAEHRFAFDAHGMTVERDIHPVVATTDGEMLSHVLSNLLGNAIKYRSRDRAPLIGLSLREAGGGVVVTVMDNGIGMSPEEIGRAFDRFWQATASAEGAGVGLSISKRIVEDLGGTIELASPGKGMGTIVTVTLPGDGGGAREGEG